VFSSHREGLLVKEEYGKSEKKMKKKGEKNRKKRKKTYSHNRAKMMSLVSDPPL